jgi:hypothetical protein
MKPGMRPRFFRLDSEDLKDDRLPHRPTSGEHSDRQFG